MARGTIKAAVGIAAIWTAAGAGEPRGEPWTLHVIDGSSQGADGTRLADVNGDGLPDIATGWEEGGIVRAYLNPGPEGVRQPWPAVTVGRVGSPEDAVFVDLDGDGAFDIVSSCEGREKSVFVHWAPRDPARFLDPGAWTTEAFPALRGAQMWMFALPMQVDGAHGPDLVLGSKGKGAQIGWLRAPPNPRDTAAWTWHPLREAGWVMSLLAADMNGNGRLDIVASDRRGARRGVFWLENPGPGPDLTRPWREHPIGAEDKEVMFITLADLDRDGLVDVVAATRGPEIIWLRRTAAHPPAWDSIVIPMPPNTGTAKSVAVGDINLDGKPDIVVSCENARGVSGVVWLSRDDTRWTAHEISGPTGTKFDLVKLIDMDGDGDLDVLTCEESENLGVIWYENPARSPTSR